MSIHPALAQIDQVLLPSVRDLGDSFMVRRALPAPQRQMVGPFIFLDAYGPTLLKIDQGFDSRPHPHIGLSTMSYLLQGQVLHRDNQGNAQVVRPGEVGLMTAGRGIVHSERTPRDVRATGGVLQGFQTWIALPVGHEETAPAFQHVSAEDLPLLEGEGVSLRLLAGTLLGKRAATRTFSDLFAATAPWRAARACGSTTSTSSERSTSPAAPSRWKGRTEPLALTNWWSSSRARRSCCRPVSPRGFCFWAASPSRNSGTCSGISSRAGGS